MKSDVYSSYRFAFKFVNRYHVAYPQYFRDGFPIGRIQHDLGAYANDFIFAEDAAEVSAQMFETDFGTARGYDVAFEVDGESHQGVVLSHESGLEIFLIAVGAFVGIEVAKFSLKRILETLEARINEWYNKIRDKEPPRGRRSAPDPNAPLVERIAIRTPFWELSLDGRFTSEERDRIPQILHQSMITTESVEEQFASVRDPRLAQKLGVATRKIVRRFEPEVKRDDG